MRDEGGRRGQSGKGTERELFEFAHVTAVFHSMKKNKVECNGMFIGWASAVKATSLLCNGQQSSGKAPFNGYDLCSPYIKLFPKTMHKNINSCFSLSFLVAGESGPMETLLLHSSWIPAGMQSKIPSLHPDCCVP